MITPGDRLSNIIATNIDLLPIVYRFGILSGLGQKRITDVCQEHGIDTGFFLAVLNTYHSGDYFPEPGSIDIDGLIEFLTKTHTYHKEVTIPYLTDLVMTLKKENPEKRFVLLVEKYLQEYIQKLLTHIEFEETQIFPLIKPEKRNTPRLSIAHIRNIFGQHDTVEHELSDLLMVIIQHIPESTNIRLIHEILHSLSHFEKEQINHERFEEKILVPRLLSLFQRGA